MELFGLLHEIVFAIEIIKWLVKAFAKNMHQKCITLFDSILSNDETKEKNNE